MDPKTLYRMIKDAPQMIDARGDSLTNCAKRVKATFAYAKKELGKEPQQRNAVLPNVKYHLRQAVLQIIWISSSGGRHTAERLAEQYAGLYKLFELQTELPDNPVSQFISAKSIDDLAASANAQ